MPSVYEVITARIVDKLEAGTVPWHKPWNVETGAPRNIVSGKPYRGINAILTGMQTYASPFWGTYRQIRELGGHVRKGERATPIVFWKLLESEDREGNERTIPLARYYSVFCLDQTEGVDHKRLDDLAKPRSPFTPIERAEALVKGYPNPPTIRTDGSAAFYRPSTDSVTLPPPESFENPEAFYSVAFHELAHSTGHKSRLAREGVTDPQRFGNHEYSKEELIAEMSASFLRSFAGIDSEPLMDNSAAYLASWLRVLRKDSRMVVFAAAAAQKAVDWIVGKKAPDEVTELALAAWLPERGQEEATSPVISPERKTRCPALPSTPAFLLPTNTSNLSFKHFAPTPRLAA
jgi:antirestriction protein ArdC